jgi:hypothetical protein
MLNNIWKQKNAPKWDGHTSADVIQRITDYLLKENEC